MDNALSSIYTMVRYMTYKGPFKNITEGGGGLRLFHFRRRNLHPLRGLAESGIPPLRIGRIPVPLHIYMYIIIFNRHLYVLCCLIWVISFILIINIWQNLGSPVRRLAKSGCPSPTLQL